MYMYKSVQQNHNSRILVTMFTKYFILYEQIWTITQNTQSDASIYP